MARYSGDISSSIISHDPTDFYDWENIRRKVTPLSGRNPSFADDHTKGYNLFSRIIRTDVSPRTVWVCTNPEEDNASWIEIAKTGTSSTSNVSSNHMLIDFDDSSPINIGSELPENCNVSKIIIDVTTAYTGGSGSSISIGDVDDIDRLGLVSESDLDTVGIYIIDTYHKYILSTQLIATYTQNSATAGVCSIEVFYTI